MSVGHELLIDPSILMLDGMEAVAAMTIASLLLLFTTQVYILPSLPSSSHPTL